MYCPSAHTCGRVGVGVGVRVGVRVRARARARVRVKDRVRGRVRVALAGWQVCPVPKAPAKGTQLRQRHHEPPAQAHHEQAPSAQGEQSGGSSRSVPSYWYTIVLVYHRTGIPSYW